MEIVELIIKKKKAAGLINFLKELDFVEVKETGRKNNKINKKLDDILIPASNPSADISTLFGAWKDADITAESIRKSL